MPNAIVEIIDALGRLASALAGIGNSQSVNALFLGLAVIGLFSLIGLQGWYEWNFRLPLEQRMVSLLEDNNKILRHQTHLERETLKEVASGGKANRGNQSGGSTSPYRARPARSASWPSDYPSLHVEGGLRSPQ